VEGSRRVARPQTDDYPKQLEQVVVSLLSEGRAAAAEQLAPIAYPRREIAARSDPPESIVAAIYKRDRFCCRYCGARVIPTQIMRLISEIFPEDFPYNRNWKGGQTHPAIASRSASLDHILAWSLGGNNDPENLACACWICNRIKGDLTLDQLDWELQPISTDLEWDGLTRYYRPLWNIAGSPKSGGHPLWMRLFQNVEAG
jgi:5-methylcytosine-specific restriction endonuclease McrA